MIVITSARFCCVVAGRPPRPREITWHYTLEILPTNGLVYPGKDNNSRNYDYQPKFHIIDAIVDEATIRTHKLTYKSGWINTCNVLCFCSYINLLVVPSNVYDDAKYEQLRTQKCNSIAELLCV